MPVGIFKNIKPLVVVFIIISVILVAATASLYVMLGGEKAEKATLKDELARVMGERKALSTEVEELKLIKNDMEVKINGLKAEKDKLAENYEYEKSQNDVVRAELVKKKNKLEQALTELEDSESKKEELQQVLQDEKIRYDKLKERVDKLVDVKSELEDKVRGIMNKQGIELERIVVKAEGELEGKVVVVNREYNFIVVDIGMSDDIELGDFLTVFRAGKFVGEAQIEKIYDTMSAATILKESKPKAIMVGDSAIVRSN